MPYVMVEELGEGQVAEDVVSRETYDAVVGERDGYSLTISELNERLEKANADLRKERQRHADYLLGGAAKEKLKDIDGLFE